MVIRKLWGTLTADIKRLAQDCSPATANSTSISHGYMMATSNRTDLLIPTVPRGSKSYPSALEVAECPEPETYESLKKTVGVGGQASVSLWRCRSSGKLVAVKHFRGASPGEARAHYGNRVMLEYSIGKSVAHDNIIQVLELHKGRGLWLQVMEYAPYDLYATVASGTMSWEEISCVFRQITNGIAHVHAQGFAHRDLKLDNVLLDQHGIVKIIDFGCAVPCTSLIHRPTVDGNVVVGTHPYVAPELFSASTVLYNAKALDVWSMAIIFCTMVLGRFPWGIARERNHAFREFCHQSLMWTKLKAAWKGVGHDDEATGDPGNVALCDIDHKIIDSQVNGSTGILSQPVVQQPDLLRRLPAESHPVIAAMLEINPDIRLTSQMVLQDAWVKQIRYCHEGPNNIVEHHRHTLCGR